MVRAANYRISSLLLLMTLLGVCLALLQISVGLGIFALVLSCFGVLYTAFSVHRRKLNSQPVCVRDLLGLFALGIIGILTAIVVLGSMLAVMGMIVSLLVGASISGSIGAGALLVLLAIGLEAGAMYLVGRRAERRNMFLIGFAAALGMGLIAVSALHWFAPSRVRSMVATFAWGIAFNAIVLGCLHDGAAKAKGWIVGCSLGLSFWGAVCLSIIEWHSPEWFLIGYFCAPPFVIWPLLLGILELERIWSWNGFLRRMACREVYRDTDAKRTRLLSILEQRREITENV